MRRLAAVLAAWCVGAALAGCSADRAQLPAPDLSSSATPTSATSTSAAPSPSSTEDKGTEGFDDSGHQAFEGRGRVKGAEERAVARAWLAYWQVRQDSYHSAEVDPAELGRVASGEAISQVVGYVRTLQRTKQHVEGDVRINVEKVRVKGDTATLDDCFENRTTNRNARGEPVERLTPFYRFRGDLVRVSGHWVVTGLVTTSSGVC